MADVWLNGKKLGQHKGAFTAFRFDVTDVLRPTGNVLVVKTDNSAPKTEVGPHGHRPAQRGLQHVRRALPDW